MGDGQWTREIFARSVPGGHDHGQAPTSSSPSPKAGLGLGQKSILTKAGMQWGEFEQDVKRKLQDANLADDSDQVVKKSRLSEVKTPNDPDAPSTAPQIPSKLRDDSSSAIVSPTTKGDAGKMQHTFRRLVRFTESILPKMQLCFAINSPRNKVDGIRRWQPR